MSFRYSHTTGIPMQHLQQPGEASKQRALVTKGVVEVERDGKVGTHAYRSKQKGCAWTKLVCGTN